MNRDAAVAQATSWRPLPSAALGHLAHGLRGSIHVIRGHAELLRAEAGNEQSHESASYIVDASRSLGGVCEDVIDFLRLPTIALGDPVVLSLEDLARSLSIIAIDHGIQLRMVAPEGAEKSIRVHPGVRRVVAHVLEHAVRRATSDPTIAVTFRSADEYAIAMSPVVADIGESDGVIAVGAQLLTAHGGAVSVCGGRMELLVPILVGAS
jgi:signal transduction histidine kinase